MANKHKKHRFRKWLVGCLSIVGLGGVAVGGYVVNVIHEAPNVTKNKLQSVARSEILDQNGKLIYAIGGSKRKYLTYDEMPTTYKNALISTEDKTFYSNCGINFKSTLGALLRDATGKASAGGSTITQQLIKLSLYSTSNKDRTIKRKIQEMWLSYHLTQQISKQKILEYYVNKIYEGHNIYGANTISWYYYNKPLNKLDLAQTAYVAGIGQAPEIYNLYTNPDNCRARRREVLLSMYNNHKITKAQFRQANNEDIMQGVVPEKDAKVFGDLTQEEKIDSNYIGAVVEQCKQLGVNVSRGGYKIYTYLDPQAQGLLYDKINNSPLYKGIEKIQSAGTIINNYTGGIVAQVGARHDDSNNPFDLNRATQTNRSSGSTIKPFTAYSPACEYLNYGSNHIVDDSPYKYAGTNVSVFDWDKQYKGKIDEKIALASSRNIPAIKLFEEVQPQRVFNFLNKNGFNVNNLETFDASKAIGLNTSTLALANGYATIANGGIYHQPSYIRSIVDESDNSQLNLPIGKQHRSMKLSTSFITFNMLQATYLNPQGTAYGIADKPNFQIAGKSGSVGLPQSNPLHDKAISDSWFVSCVHGDPAKQIGYSCALWLGYDNLNGQDGYLTNKQGTEVTTRLNNQIMNELCKHITLDNYLPPTTVKNVSGGNNSSVNTFEPLNNAQKNLLPTASQTTNNNQTWFAKKGSE